MIVNVEREPELSLYYLGSVLLKILKSKKVIPIDVLFQEIQNQLKRKIHVDFLYYALDWLFLLSLVKIEEGKVYYENKRTNSAQNQTSEEIIREIIFNEKGLKFTMDDLAAILGMSKKTIYNVFSDKNSLFLDMVDYLFDTIKESEQKIVKDTSLSTIEKIRHILGVMPESYKEIDFEQLYS